MISSRRASALLALALAGAGPALAQPQNTPARAPESQAAGGDGGARRGDREVALWLGYAESDNLVRTENGDRGTYNALGVLLDLSHQSRRIDSSLSSDLELRQYSDDTIDDEPVGTFGASVTIDLVQDRFSWRFEDNYGQGQADAFEAAGPNNRESINVFSTGPQLDLPLGARMSLSMSGDYNARRYDDSASLDSDSTVYELGLFRQTSRTARFGISATTNEVEYELAGVSPYEIDIISLRYESALATGGISAAIGMNELNFQGVATEEPLFNFEWNRALGSRSTLGIVAAREFTDTGASLGSTTDPTTPGSGTEVLLSDSPFEQKRLYVSYSIMGTKTEFTLSLGTSQDLYVDDATLDNDAITTNVSLRRNVSPRLSFGVAFDNVSRAFDNSPLVREDDEDDEDRMFSAWMNRSLGRQFGVALILTRYERRGTAPFEEDRVEIRLSYSPTDSAAAALRSAGR